MKLSTKLIIALSAILTTTLLLSSNSVENPRCEKKIDNIQEQLQRAKKADNSRRVNGLEISLSKVKAYCTDKDLIQDIEDKISDVKEDLQEHTEDYKEALKDNRANKIKKYQSKIDEDNEEIQKLENELKG